MGPSTPTVPAPTGGPPGPRLAPGLLWNQQPSAKWNPACPGQERKELLLVHFLLLFETVTTGEVRRQVHLLSSSKEPGHCSRPQHPALTPVRGKPPASPGTAGGTAGPGTGRGLRSFPSPSVETGAEGRAVCGVRAGRHSYCMSVPHTPASFRLHSTGGGCFTRRKLTQRLSNSPEATHLPVAELV